VHSFFNQIAKLRQQLQDSSLKEEAALRVREQNDDLLAENAKLKQRSEALRKENDSLKKREERLHRVNLEREQQFNEIKAELTRYGNELLKEKREMEEAITLDDTTFDQRRIRSFVGGDPAREFDQVTRDSPVGVIGRGSVIPFVEATEEPEAVGNSSPRNIVIWIGCLVVLALTPLIGGALIARRIRRSKKSESTHAEQLFDSQTNVAQPSPPESVDADEGGRSEADTIPESPYDVELPPL
jgi:hypothetical protein